MKIWLYMIVLLSYWLIIKENFPLLMKKGFSRSPDQKTNANTIVIQKHGVLFLLFQLMSFYRNWMYFTKIILTDMWKTDSRLSIRKLGHQLPSQQHVATVCGPKMQKPAQNQTKPSIQMLHTENILYNKLDYMRYKSLKKKEGPNQQETQLYDRITKIEAQVLERIQKLKAQNKTYLCQHLDIGSSDCGPYDANVNYYDKFWKRFLLNEIGKQNVSQFRSSLQTFQRKLDKIDTLFNQWEKQITPLCKGKSKNSQSQATERQKCKFCGRTYKDQQTLIIHIKIKHEEQKHSKGQQKQQESIFQQEND